MLSRRCYMLSGKNRGPQSWEVKSLHCCPMHAPALKLVQVTCEEWSHESWKTTFSQSNPRALFHVVNWNIAHGKLTIAITVAAVHGVFATVCIGSATIFIPLHMHSAGLTVFVGSFHNSRFGQFQFTKFFGKLVTRLSTLFAQSVFCAEVTQILALLTEKAYMICFRLA